MKIYIPNKIYFRLYNMETVANYVLINVSPVVDLVFSYLSGKSLSNAAQVCTSWCTATRRELKKRTWWDIGLLQCPNDVCDDVQINLQVILLFINQLENPQGASACSIYFIFPKFVSMFI